MIIRIGKSVHDEVLKVEDMLKVGIFMSVHQGQLEEYRVLYKKVLTHGINELK